MVMKPANIKGANKNAKIYVGRSSTVQNVLFRTHTLCMNYVTKTFLNLYDKNCLLAKNFKKEYRLSAVNLQPSTDKKWNAK